MDRKKQNIFFSLVGGIGFFLILIFILSKIIVFNSYESEKYGFTMKFPEGWITTENQHGTAVAFNSPLESELDVFSENFNVVIQDISPEVTLADYSTTAFEQMKTVFSDLLIVESYEPVRLSGLDAVRFVYQGKGDQADLKIMHIWMIKDAKAYILTYMATERDFKRFLPLAKKMFRSFKVY